MKRYNVTKWDDKTDKMVADYGPNGEHDVKLITRGYKPFVPDWDDESKSTMYTRKNSRYYFWVEEI